MATSGRLDPASSQPAFLLSHPAIPAAPARL